GSCAQCPGLGSIFFDQIVHHAGPPNGSRGPFPVPQLWNHHICIVGCGGCSRSHDHELPAAGRRQLQLLQPVLSQQGDDKVSHHHWCDHGEDLVCQSQGSERSG